MYKPETPPQKFIIENVILEPRGEELKLIAADGQVCRIQLYGDCCSHTFFDEDAKLDVRDCLGHELKMLEEIGEQPGREAYPDSDFSTAFYGLRIVTDKGDFVIPFRNESNGYYGGTADVYWS